MAPQIRRYTTIFHNDILSLSLLRKGQDKFMANFTVRVELHEVNMVEPSGDDYERLHLAMQRRQYFRVIRSSDDTWYHLPHAEYTVTWQATITDVLAEVVSIAKSVW